MRKITSVIAAMLFSIVSLSGNAFAKNIVTLDVTSENNQMTISGTTEEGVLAIAVLVYSEEDLVYMETCPVADEAYSCTLDKTFENGDYLVKIADYDGGEYKTEVVSLAAENPEGPEETPKAPNAGHETIKQVAEVAASVLALGLAAGLVMAIFFGKKLLHKK